MKKIFYSILFLMLTSCFLSKAKKPDLPSFNLLLLDSATYFNTNQIPEGNPIILLFFSPDCDHCQEETVALLKNMDLFKNVKFYFITIDPMNRLRVFNKYFKMYNYPNILLGKDNAFFFPIYFKPSGTPYLILYDQQKQLRGVFSGRTNASELSKFINKL